MGNLCPSLASSVEFFNSILKQQQKRGGAWGNNLRKLTLDDWYDLCDQFREQTNASLSWGIGFCGWDYDDGEALRINRDFLRAINDFLAEQDVDRGEA